MMAHALTDAGVERGPAAEHLHRRGRAVLGEVADQAGSDLGYGDKNQRILQMHGAVNLFLRDL